MLRHHLAVEIMKAHYGNITGKASPTSAAKATGSLIGLANRAAGVPPIEIVTKPIAGAEIRAPQTLERRFGKRGSAARIRCI